MVNYLQSHRNLVLTMFLCIAIVFCGIYPVLGIAIIATCTLPVLIKPKSYLFISLFLSPIYIGYGISKYMRQIDFGTLDNIIKCGFLFVLGFFMVLSGEKLRKDIVFPFYANIAVLCSIIYAIPIFSAVSVSDSFYFLKLIIPVLLFMITVKFYDELDWEKVQKWFVVLLIAHFIVSIPQFLSENAAYDIARASGLTPSRNTFSMFMVMMFNFLFVIVALRNKRKLTIKDFLLLAMISMLEFVSFSRGAWAVFVATAVIFFIWQRRYLLLVTVSALGSGLAYLYWEKIQLRINVFGYGTEEHRNKITTMLIEKGNESPLFGHGFGWAQEFMIMNDIGLIQPHNDYVRFFVDMGYVGLSFVLLPFALIFFRMVYLIVKSKEQSVRTVSFITLLSILQVGAFMYVYNVYDMFYATISFVWFFAAVSEMEYRKKKLFKTKKVVQGTKEIRVG
ncbi:O-antigen ligase family protein [Paenibacillus tarimensis]